MRVLVAGGAGYIGSFMVRMLAEQGHEAIVLDNLSTGHREALVGGGVPFIEADLSDAAALKEVFSGPFRIDAVMHFAALIEVGESVQDPLKYYRNNVANTLGLLAAMREAGVHLLIFSSSAAVFGNPERIPIEENDRQQPVNPYGWSKFMVERVLGDLSRTGALDFVSLRYFNAAGAHPDGTLGEDHPRESHLIPLILKAVLEKNPEKPLKLFGADYDTADGTCIRDYIHVMDLAKAHLLALGHLAAGGKSEVYNLGNGTGYSVLEVIRAAERVTGRRVPVQNASRRPGDAPALVASANKIGKALGWKPDFPDLETIIETAWKWHTGHPMGYGQSL